jgi:hypothetical protein
MDKGGIGNIDVGSDDGVVADTFACPFMLLCGVFSFSSLI